MNYASFIENSGKRSFEATVGIIIVAILVMAVRAGIMLWLWNALATRLFAAPSITFWEAMGLIVLARAIVGVNNSTNSH